jgi:hypothetical protein
VKLIFLPAVEFGMHPKNQWCQQFTRIGVISKCTMNGNVIQQWFGGGQI